MVKVHYTNRGSSQRALVFVHGWMCDHTVWKHQLDAFPQARVIAIDLPGHGESEKPQTRYTVDLHARAIGAVLRDAHVERAVLIGHSYGAPVIRQFFRMFPERTAGLVIVDGALRPFAPPEQVRQFIEPMRGSNYSAYCAHLIDGMVHRMSNTEAQSQIQRLVAAAPQHVAVSEMESLLDDALWYEDKITVPTLVILAKQPAWNDDYENFVRDLVPNVDYRVWPGVSHFLMIDRPDEFNAAVAEFVARNKLI